MLLLHGSVNVPWWRMLVAAICAWSWLVRNSHLHVVVAVSLWQWLRGLTERQLTFKDSHPNLFLEDPLHAAIIHTMFSSSWGVMDPSMTSYEVYGILGNNKDICMLHQLHHE